MCRRGPPSFSCAACSISSPSSSSRGASSSGGSFRASTWKPDPLNPKESRVMRNRIGGSIGLALLLMLGLSGGADAADKIKAVASFSILGDLVKQVGGDRVEVVTLVAPDSDAHVFDPTPADAKMLASADIFFVNGLGFEGWMERLETASGFKGAVVVASKGVKLTMSEEE